MTDDEKLALARILVIDQIKGNDNVARDAALQHLLNIVDWVTANGDRFRAVDAVLRYFPGARAATENGVSDHGTEAVGVTQRLPGGTGRTMSQGRRE